MNNFKTQFSFLEGELRDDILSVSSIKTFEKNVEILKEEQYIKVLPLVLKGLVKVFSRFGDKELLLYYIQPMQSCVMSFAALLKNRPSRVFAITEEETEILLLPAEKIPGWIKTFPSFNELFYQQYDMRYTDLLDTIEHILVNKMDVRLYDYLLRKAEIAEDKSLKISHGQIANELGTAREVITRVIKKLESEGKVKQSKNGIVLL